MFGPRYVNLPCKSKYLGITKSINNGIHPRKSQSASNIEIACITAARHKGLSTQIPGIPHSDSVHAPVDVAVGTKPGASRRLDAQVRFRLNTKSELWTSAATSC